MSFGTFQFRRGTAAQWTSANPVLAAGELAIETDTAKFKLGDGTTAWNSLAYGGIQGPTGATPNAFTTITGNSGTATADNSSDTLAVTGAGPITTAATDTPDGLVVSIAAATTSAAGTQSALDKKKQDGLYYDVTANSISTMVGDDSTDNLAAWNTLFAALPVGAHVHFPSGTYRFSGDMVISADKHIRITGNSKYSSIIKTTSATANGFHINGPYWYNTFEDLRFETTANKTAGAAIFLDLNGAAANAQIVGANILRCSFSNWFKAIYALGSDVTHGPGNLSIWDSLDISIPGTTGSPNARGVHVNGGGTNLVISNSTINLGFPPFQVTGTAGIEVNSSGAIQLQGNDFIGGINTLLLNASAGGSTSVAAVYATNCFFDQSGGSTVKITGANVVNRVKFVQCGITGGNVAGATAVEIASTGTGAAGTATAAADGIDFFDCDLYPNGGSGTTNGFLITGAQGVSINACRISGWTNAIAITPAVSNGYTKLQVSGNKLGATNNFTTPNTNGLVLNAGSFQFGAVVVTGNDFTGSTTPLVENATVAQVWQEIYRDNLGIVTPASYGTIAAAAQALTASADNVLTGTLFQLPTNGLRIGSKIKFRFGVTKTAAGVSTWAAKVKFGTAGTNADAAIATYTSGTNTALGDQGTYEIIVEVTALGAAATAKGNLYGNNAYGTAVTGLGSLPMAPTSTATFNTGAASPFLHLDITPGSLAVMTGVGSVEVIN